MTQLFSPSLEQVESAMFGCDNIGWCRSCGAEHYNCEPDARNYECEDCNKRLVFGAEEFLLRGWVQS